MLSKTQIKEEAFSDIELLNSVAKFKDKFYHCSWAKYNEANIEKIKLIPSKETINILKDDFNKMEDMIFGEIPTFDEIIEGLVQVEKEVRSLK